MELLLSAIGGAVALLVVALVLRHRARLRYAALAVDEARARANGRPYVQIVVQQREHDA